MDDMQIEHPELMAALRTLAVDDAASGTSAAVQVRLLDHVRRLRRARRHSLVKMSAMAAGLCIATALPIWHLATHDLRNPSSPVAPRLVAAMGDEVATPFFPLAYSTVPMSGGRLVRHEVPRATATAYGLEMPRASGNSASDNVLADVIVGDDGLARAVRFVRPMTREGQRERKR
jgi:hypothetical protein